MHTELSSFLADVWENRDVTMYGNPDPTGDTIEDRVYSIYAPQHGIGNAGITKDVYQARVNGILAPPNSGWRASQRNWAFVWDNASAASLHANYRIYVNAKPNYAVNIFQRIMQMSARPVPQAQPMPPHLRQAMPQLPPHVAATGYMAQANRGNYADVVVGAKIAFADEAFSGRPDVIVVYLNQQGGRQLAAHLAERIANFGDFFRNDLPPMTERIAWGVSIGPEVSGQQWTVGTSFGMVRANLIAWAMIETVTALPTAAGPHPVPLVAHPAGSPNRLDFFRIVTNKFAQFNIDSNAPWT
jgi:hypothetical protein